MDKIFLSVRDFFIKDKNIVVTRRWLSKRSKITGSRVPYLFRINPESLSPFPKKNLYEVWENQFEFRILNNNKERLDKKKGNRENREEPIVSYLNKQLNKSFKQYPIDVYDIFIEEEYLGGVPDAVDNEDTLEIKTTEVAEGYFYPSVPYINHQLQLALYVALRKQDIGYLCLCRYNKSGGLKIDPKSDLERKEYKNLGEGKDEVLVFELDGSNKEFIYRYRILEFGENSDGPKEKLCLFKIEIKREEFMEMMDYVTRWFFGLSYFVSPEIPEKRFRELMYYLKQVEVT